MKTATKPSATEQIEVVLRRLHSHSNVAGRVDCLKAATSTPFLQKAMLYAYSPYIRFGVNITQGVHYHLISQIESSNLAPLGIDSDEVWELLDNLRTSTASSSFKVEELTRLFRRLDQSTGSIVIGILKKNLARGVAASTVNKAWPGHIPSFKVQLSAKYSDRKIKSFPAYVEPKYDGMRAIAIAHPTGEVEFCTRTGRPITAAAYFADEVARLAKEHRKAIEAGGETYEGTVFDGEVLGVTFNDTVSVFRKDVVATSGNYMIFDLLPMAALTDPSFVSPGYTDRRGMLEHVMGSVTHSKCKISPSYQVNSKAEIWALYDKSRELGYEGLIVKATDGKWLPKRSNDWLKIKAEESLDLQIIGGFEGEGELEGTLGGLIVDYEGVRVRVGSGFTHRDRDLLYADFMNDVVESDSGGTDFVLFGMHAEVQYQEVTPAGSLRHPVFIRLRKDKDEVQF